MVRKLKDYDPEIQYSIYKPLKKRCLGFNDLVHVSGVNQGTVNEYLAHAKDAGEIAKGRGRRGEYHLTPKGHDKLERIRIERKNVGQKQRKWYDGDVDSIDQLWNMKELVDPLMFGTVEKEMPLPLPAYAALYGSVELDCLRETAESSVLNRRAIEDQWDATLGAVWSWIDHAVYGSKFPPNKPKKLGSKTLHSEARQFLTAEWTRQIVKRVMRVNLFHLLDLHRAYHNAKLSEEPPPLSLENILGFDITLTVSYNGSKLRTPPESTLRALLNRQNMQNRLVGWLLLEIAYEEGRNAPKAFQRYPSTSLYHSLYETIPLLEKAGVLRSEDVDRIRQGGIVRVAFRRLEEASALAFKDEQTRQVDKEMWIKIVERYIEHCPQCGTRFGPNDRCTICETPRADLRGHQTRGESTYLMVPSKHEPLAVMEQMGNRGLFYTMERTGQGWRIDRTGEAVDCDKRGKPHLFTWLRNDGIAYPMQLGECMERLWAISEGKKKVWVQRKLDRIAHWVSETEKARPHF